MPTLLIIVIIVIVVVVILIMNNKKEEKFTLTDDIKNLLIKQKNNLDKLTSVFNKDKN